MLEQKQPRKMKSVPHLEQHLPHLESNSCLNTNHGRILCAFHCITESSFLRFRPKRTPFTQGIRTTWVHTSTKNDALWNL